MDSVRWSHTQQSSVGPVSVTMDCTMSSSLCDFLKNGFPFLFLCILKLFFLDSSMLQRVSGIGLGVESPLVSVPNVC